MHIIFIGIGLLSIWCAYQVFGPKGFLKLMAALTLFFVLVCSMIVGGFVWYDHTHPQSTIECDPWECK